MQLQEYQKNNGLFLLADGENYAAIYEIRGFPTEGRTEQHLKSYANMIQQLIASIERYPLSKSPYIVQCYLTDEPNLFSWYSRLKNYASKEIQQTKLNQVYVEMAKAHMKFMCQDGGAFTDSLTGNAFKGGERVVRLVISRKGKPEAKENRLKSMLNTARDIQSKLRTFSKRGLSFRKYDDADVYQWLFLMFNKKISGFDDPSDYLDRFPFLRFSGSEENGLSGTRAKKSKKSQHEHNAAKVSNDIPYGYDFMEQAFYTGVKSFESKKIWKVGDTYHKYLSCTGIHHAPKYGHVTAEREVIEGVYESFFDTMPEHSTFQITFVCQDAKEVEADIKAKFKSASKSTSTDAQILTEETGHWLKQLNTKNYLFPTQMGCFVTANDEEALEDRYNQAKSNLVNAGIEVLDEQYDLYALDKFLRFLPANYNHSFDKYYYGSRLLTIDHIARLLPIGYARCKGTGNPMICDYNRNGEPVTFDTFVDLANNPHLLMLGTTGAGKSVRSANMLLSVMAIYRPYLMLVDAGESFKFVVDFFEYMGLNVQRFVIKRPSVGDVRKFSLNPFAETQKMIKQLKELRQLKSLVDIARSVDEEVNQEINTQDSTENLKDIFKDVDEDQSNEFQEVKKDQTNHKNQKENDEDLDDLEDLENSEDEDLTRDYLAEFQLAALLMCSDGKEPEEVGITYDHRSDLSQCVIESVLHVVDELGKDQMIPSDLLKYMRSKVQLLESSEMQHERGIADRVRMLSNRLHDFLDKPMNSYYFDAPSEPLGNADVTYFELGTWKNDNDSNEGARALAFVTMMNRNMAQAESRQHKEDSRFSLFFGDECHIVTTKKITAAQLTQCAKMSRKVGLYLWLVTQQAKDFNGNAAKMLGMFEYWICLEMSLKDFKQVTEYIDITPLEEQLFKTVHNEKGVYTEGVILSKRHKLLIRCFPFREFLFLALNERNEKSKRARICNEYQCNEVEAAFIQAQLAKGLEVNLPAIRRLLGSDHVVAEKNKEPKKAEEKEVTHESI